MYSKSQSKGQHETKHFLQRERRLTELTPFFPPISHPIHSIQKLFGILSHVKPSVEIKWWIKMHHPSNTTNNSIVHSWMDMIRMYGVSDPHLFICIDGWTKHSQNLFFRFLNLELATEQSMAWYSRAAAAAVRVGARTVHGWCSSLPPFSRAAFWWQWRWHCRNYKAKSLDDDDGLAAIHCHCCGKHSQIWILTHTSPTNTLCT